MIIKKKGGGGDKERSEANVATGSSYDPSEVYLE